MEPIGYLDFLALQSHAALVLTDSGGIQEETTYLAVPCLTIRPNTERPVTITQGTNQLVDHHKESLIAALYTKIRAPRVRRNVPSLWDGHTATRVGQVFQQI